MSWLVWLRFVVWALFIINEIHRWCTHDFYIFILQLVPWSPSYFCLQLISVSNNQASLFLANVQSPFSRFAEPPFRGHFNLDPILLLTQKIKIVLLTLLIYFLIFSHFEFNSWLIIFSYYQKKKEKKILCQCLGITKIVGFHRITQLRLNQWSSDHLC